jgi:hypothetical protein
MTPSFAALTPFPAVALVTPLGKVNSGHTAIQLAVQALELA